MTKLGKILLFSFSCILILCMELSASTFAQVKKKNSTALYPQFDEKFMISLVPVPLFFNGFRVDFDVRLSEKLWLNLTPQYNAKKADSVSLSGFTMMANFRYIDPKYKGFYVAVGAGGDYNKITDVTKSGQLYSLSSMRFGGQLQLGYMVTMWRRTKFDIYIGAAFRHSVNKYDGIESEQIVLNDDVKPWKYHYDGIFMQAGIRIGIML